jgi:hypothetical protein
MVFFWSARELHRPRIDGHHLGDAGTLKALQQDPVVVLVGFSSQVKSAIFFNEGAW